MKYLSIDLEFTGLNPDHSQILEVGLVAEDTNKHVPVKSLPCRSFYVYNDKPMTGEPYALAMNHKIIEAIAKRKEPEFGDDELLFVHEDRVADEIWAFVSKNLRESDGSLDKASIAGKNVARDRRFLRRLPGWDAFPSFHHRIIDPGMLYWHHTTDKVLPDTQTCIKRAGIKWDFDHRALHDAQLVVELVRRGYDYILERHDNGH